MRQSSADSNPKLQQSFGADLMVAARQLYVYTEIVLARHTVAIGEIHDIRIKRALDASNAVRSTLRSLKSHFPARLQPCLDSVDNLANYLHQSFNASLQYRHPYSSYNPFGICVDVAQFDQRLVKQTFEPLVIDVFRMATMGMLLVHHFVLEFTMFLCSVADDFCETPMLVREYKGAFVGIMQEIHSYMTMYTEEIKFVAEVLNAPSRDPVSDVMAELKKHMRSGKIDHFIDFFQSLGRFDKFLEAKEDAMKQIRMLYFSFIVSSLSQYFSNPVNDLVTTTQSDLFCQIKLASNMVHNQQYRIFEDDNRRHSLLENFMGQTKKPVYHYATKAWSATNNSLNEMVIKNTPGRVEVVPRCQVHIWRKRTEWTEDDWKHAAYVHGELSLCMDLMYNMVPVVLNNRNYRQNSSVDISMLHMVITRAFGMLDTVTLLQDFQKDGFLAAMFNSDAALESIPDPSIPAAVAVQPMPKALDEWLNKLFEKLQAPCDIYHTPTHAKIHRPTSINANDILRPSNVDPAFYNVLWRRRAFPANQWKFDYIVAANSMFLLNYGDALVRIPTTVEQKTYGSDNLRMDVATGYARRCDSTVQRGLLNDTAPIEYLSARDYQWQLMDLIKEFNDNFKSKPPPFLNPKSWLWDTAGWVMCDASTDVHGGTLLIMRVDDPDDGDDGDASHQAIKAKISEKPPAANLAYDDAADLGKISGGKDAAERAARAAQIRADIYSHRGRPSAAASVHTRRTGTGPDRVEPSTSLADGGGQART